MHIMGKVLWDLDSRKNILMKIRIFQTQKMKAELKANLVNLEMRTKEKVEGPIKCFAGNNIWDWLFLYEKARFFSKLLQIVILQH